MRRGYVLNFGVANTPGETNVEIVSKEAKQLHSFVQELADTVLKGYNFLNFGSGEHQVKLGTSNCGQEAKELHSLETC